MDPKVIRIDGPGTFTTPPVIAVPYLIAPEGGSPVRICFKLDDGVDLQVPLAPHLIRELLGLLKPHDPDRAAQ